MDFRDIEHIVNKEIKEGLVITFDLLYSKSVELLEDYKRIERWPATLEKMSISSNHKQKIVKECVYRVFEELCEATVEEFGGGKFTEELADASLFFMEMLVILGFNETEDLVRLVEQRTPNWADSIAVPLTMTTENFIEEIAYLGNFDMELEIDDYSFGEEAFNMLSIIGRFGNSLKNRPWRQTKVLTDENKALDLLSESIFQFFSFVRFFGGDEILKFIHMKQRVNEFRIRSKY